MTWKPGQRKAKRALEEPHFGVPAHLGQPLWNWVEGCFGESVYGLDSDRPATLALDLRRHMPAGSTYEQVAVLRDWCNKDRDFMLDLVEAMLERYGWDGGRAGGLNNLLTEANSAYTVRAAWDGLEERVSPGVKELVSEAVNAPAGSAGDHLAHAWNAAYGRSPDPVKSYSEAIKAVEAALAGRVSPQNGKQTLGTMIRDITSKPSKWKFVIADGSVSGVETVLHMMRTLWEGQTSRHGGPDQTRAETAAEARAAVHLAAALVQFGVSGTFDLV
ncbi:hypothetical protein [Kribbella sancticallisti]|uniref:hypothetical protein n=1 Tax=Kribbella sancticallisti TaxID=460087 RepID=UPI0031D78165